MQGKPQQFGTGGSEEHKGNSSQTKWAISKDSQ